MNATIQFTCPQCSHSMQLLASAVGQQGKCAECGTVVTVSFDESSSPATKTPATAIPLAAPPQPSIAIDTSPKRTPANGSDLGTKKRKTTPNRKTIAVITGVVAVVFVFGPILGVYLGRRRVLRQEYQKAEKVFEGALRARRDRIRLANYYLEEGHTDVDLRQLKGVEALKRLNEATDRSTELLAEADKEYEYAYRKFDQACRKCGIKNKRTQEMPLLTPEMREKWQAKTREKKQEKNKEQQLRYALTHLKPRRYKVENGKFELDLFSNKFAIMNLSYIKGLTEVTYLDLSGNATLSNAGLVHLKGLTKLEELRLYSTQITDAGLVHLKELSNLQRLWLSSKITDAGVVHLKGLTNLEELRLGSTQITDEGVAELQKALPDCKMSP